MFPVPPGKKMTEMMGTPEYMAPEQILGSYGPEIDVWSAGVVMYLAMCGVPPFWASSRRAVKEAILSKEVSFTSPKWASISGECKDLISKMLNKNPCKRVTPLAILGAYSCQVCVQCDLFDNVLRMHLMLSLCRPSMDKKVVYSIIK